jgi:hypothetical protein
VVQSFRSEQDLNTSYHHTIANASDGSLQHHQLLTSQFEFMKTPRKRSRTRYLKNTFSRYHHLLFKLLHPRPGWLLFTLDFTYHLACLFKPWPELSSTLLPIHPPDSTIVLSQYSETIS